MRVNTRYINSTRSTSCIRPLERAVSLRLMIESMISRRECHAAQWYCRHLFMTKLLSRQNWYLWQLPPMIVTVLSHVWDAQSVKLRFALAARVLHYAGVISDPERKVNRKLRDISSFVPDRVMKFQCRVRSVCKCGQPRWTVPHSTNPGKLGQTKHSETSMKCN